VLQCAEAEATAEWYDDRGDCCDGTGDDGRDEPRRDVDAEVDEVSFPMMVRHFIVNTYQRRKSRNHARCVC